MSRDVNSFNVTAEELVIYRKAFNYYDRNKNGVIDTKELGYLMRTLGQNPTENELLEICNQVDDDENGTMSFKEFLTLMSKQQSLSPEELQQAFRVFDRNCDGYIDGYELKHLLTNLGEKLTEEEVDEMICEVDMDGNGLVDYEEFVTMLQPSDAQLEITDAQLESLFKPEVEKKKVRRRKESR